MTFYSSISLFWILPWLVLSILLARWLYLKESWLNSLNKRFRLLLIGLRAFVLFLIGILLLGIVFESTFYRVEKPVIITLVDRSASMRNYKDSNQILNQIKSFQQNLSEDLGDTYDFVSMVTGSTTDYRNIDQFNDVISNLSDGFEKIKSDFYNRNVGAIVFISDGNYNSGNHPVYSAENINFTPVFTLGVGDTIKKRDHYIKNVTCNDVAFFKNKFPVEVDVESIKIGKVSATVDLLKNGKKIASQKLTYQNSTKDFQHVSFLVDADEVGFHTYSVRVSSLPNEFNYKNNQRVFYIEVVDSRQKILMLGGAPHPDISAMKLVLEENPNYEVVSLLTKDWNKELNRADLIVWHEPGVNFDPALNEAILKLSKPVFYVIGPNTSSGVLQKLSVGLSITGGNQFDEIQGVVNNEFKQFELSDELIEAVRFFPPLKSKFGDLRVSGGAETAIFQSVAGIKKKDPLWFFNKRGGTKYGVVFGEGMWRWKVNDFVKNQSFTHFSELIQSSIQYLSVKQNQKALQINFPKRYTKDEEVIVNASFYNESMEPITDPEIQFYLEDQNKKSSKLQFGISGNSYKLSLGKMNPGKYSWRATTTFNGKKYSKSGVFVVEDIAIEFQDTYANHSVLQQISNKTNGAFRPLSQYQQIIQSIKSRDDITTLSFKENSFNELIDFKFILLLLVIALFLEWFLRRWLGAY